MHYRQQNQPGCSGCLLVAGLLVLLTGGAPALLRFFGFLVFSGLLGFVLLIGAFWLFTYTIQRRVATYQASQTEAHNRFVHLLVQILVKIAQVDGHFTKAELATMLNFFQYNLHYNQDQMYWVKQLIKEARHNDADLDDLLQEFRTGFGYEARLILLDLIYQIVHLKKPVLQEELALARRIASILQVTAWDLRTIEARYMYTDQGAGTTTSTAMEEQYYAVLGLEPGADFVAVKKAYRKLSMQYHPDKVSHLGEEFKQVAEEKMKEINAAYDYFKKKWNGA